MVNQTRPLLPIAVPTPVRHPRPPGAAGAVKKTEPAMSRSHPPVSIIGAPPDIGAGTRGARLGPEERTSVVSGKSVPARVNPGGRLHPKKKETQENHTDDD